MEKISSFEELILLSSKKKEIQLKYDLENNVNLIKFSEGKIDISFNEKLDKNFVRNLSEKLLEWTGNRWVITLAKKAGQKTFSELKKIKNKELFDQEKKSEIYKKFKNIFLIIVIFFACSFASLNNPKASELNAPNFFDRSISACSLEIETLIYKIRSFYSI